MPKTLESTDAATAARRRPTPARLAWLIGPALVAGVAYLDPGNVASNMTAGARYGYLLVWVVVLGNVMAWLIQYLSAKLGIVTGRSLPETLGTRIRRPWARRAYWLQAELVAMATDIAEVIGGAVALNLLFGIPLLWGGVITGTVSIALLLVQSRRGARPFEFVVIGLLAIIAIGFSFGVFVAPPDPAGVVAGLVPRFEGTDSVLLAASILGATIMPHAIYAHSALARDRFAPTPRSSSAPTSRSSSAPTPRSSSERSETKRPEPPTTESATDAAPLNPARSLSERSETKRPEPSTGPLSRTPLATTDASTGVPVDLSLAELRGIPTRRLLRATKWDVTIAMLIAGTVNLCILLLAAANLAGVPGTDSLEGAYAALYAGLGPLVATLFAVGLLASGLASTSVGAYAGAEIMHGLLHVRVPLLARRLVTLIPALVILAIGFDPTVALVLSQVVLSFGIPFALIPLVALTAKHEVLGGYRNRVWTTVAGVAASVFLIALNGVLLWLVLTGA
ncbi:Nramp family divalent metal transporter [Microbacterium sp. M3]|uniref:Nramp family divalent metal transporter n=1 Tax=Microbacterium arthrosphaerae TaxID=792652 RepID=A0ABU4H3Z2_9MICO|nr:MULTISPECIES: Nramp family divalent metal transporter [Microbacterium]MDW4574052.1 Nramp family divalent metal transporter [Microbacterium arthrosphaerae]MDW7607907.1 Nramp family divalent metal transporter [Microbacterium sp. M3]